MTDNESKSELFLEAFEVVLASEGFWTLTVNKNDRGGMTFAGISRRANPDWKGWGLIDVMGETHGWSLSRDELEWSNDEKRLAEMVKTRYYQNYWMASGCHNLDHPSKALLVFDCAVLGGVRTAIRLLQLASRSAVDGILGPATIAAAVAVDPELFAFRYTFARTTRYEAIIKRSPSQSVNLKGWRNRALHLLEGVLG